jgi:hypothetical protein
MVMDWRGGGLTCSWVCTGGTCDHADTTAEIEGKLSRYKTDERYNAFHVAAIWRIVVSFAELGYVVLVDIFICVGYLRRNCCQMLTMASLCITPSSQWLMTHSKR